MTDTPLARAQAAGYTLGPWTTDGAHAATEVRCWLRDGERAGFMPAACVFVGSSERAAFWQAREPTDFPDCPRIVEERIPDADLATLRARADVWLGVVHEPEALATARGNAKRLAQKAAGLAARLHDAEAERDRLAAEVERLRAGIEATADDFAFRASLQEIEAAHENGEQRHGRLGRAGAFHHAENTLRSLLTPTPEAP